MPNHAGHVSRLICRALAGKPTPDSIAVTLLPFRQAGTGGAQNAGDQLAVRGEVVRAAKQVAYAEASVRGADGQIVSRATGTFLLHREATS